MPLQKEVKTKLITDYHRHDADTGSPEVQIAILTGRIQQLTDHLRANKKDESCQVMREAHLQGIPGTATMMFGSVEGPEDIIEHLHAVRRLQDKTGGFTAFIPWSFQPGNTELGGRRSETGRRKNKNPKLIAPASKIHTATAVDYLRVPALSRIYLDNVHNIQASWVTQGLKMAQVALRFGANDFGSTMLEENVVAATGVKFSTTVDGIVEAIRGAGFIPVQRDMYYHIIKYR